MRREYELKIFEVEENDDEDVQWHLKAVDPALDPNAPEAGVADFDIGKLTFESVAFSFVMAGAIMKYADPKLEEKLVEESIYCGLMMPH